MDRSKGLDPTKQTDRPNLSTEYQEEGGARHPSDTLDRDNLKRGNGGEPIPSNYNPDTMTRVGEENDTRAGQEGAGEDFVPGRDEEDPAEDLPGSF